MTFRPLTTAVALALALPLLAPGDVLATDQDGRTLYVIGPRLRVNSRGIVD